MKLIKEFILGIINLFVMSTAVVLVGFLLMICAYAFNQDVDYSSSIYTSTANVLKSEKDYSLVTENQNSRLDNFTDSLMILTAMHPIKEYDTIVSASLKNSRTQSDKGKSPRETFNQDISKGYERDYSRYWHGYLIFLKPLLKHFDFKQIRIINAIFQGMLLFAFILLLCKKKYYFLIIPFLCTYGLISPLTIASSLQYSSVWYLVLIGSIFYLMFQEKIIEHNLHYLYFALLGMLTSYFDLLTYPIATLGILLVIVVSTEKITPFESIKRIIVCGISWTFGYAIMWLSKILLAAWVLGDNGVIEEAKSAFITRKSNLTNKGAEITTSDLYDKLLKSYSSDMDASIFPFLEGTKINKLFMSSLFVNCFMVSTVLGFLCILWSILKNTFLNRKLQKKNEKMTNTNIDDLNGFSFISCARLRYILNIICKVVIITGLSLITIVWYQVLKQHTYIHSFMTYRTMSVAFFALFSLLFKIAYDLDRVFKYMKENNKGENNCE